MSSPTGPTPPPPPMYAAPVQPTAPEPAGPGLSEPQRLVNTFFAPSTTFTDIRRNASWWVPLLLISVFSISFFVMIDKKVGFEQVARTMLANNKAIQQLSPAQQEQAYARTAIGLKVGEYAAPIFILIYVLITAAVLMATFNFMMDAQVSFSQSMAIVMYGWLPGIVGAVLSIFALSFGDPEGFRMDNPIGTNPAHFMDPTSTPKFLYAMLTSLDVISLWIIVLIGIGFALNAKKKISTGAAVGTVAVWYFIAKLCGSAFAALRG
ncbi:MAG TPA: YIP1 family protein [Candidatus Binatia bacterium]|nr:YIP1 family protein [Candidatus Binatia bacterium]